MPWIGVDLDGTLAEYHGWNDGEIGEPVPLMLSRVKLWLAQGKEVRIFTARVGVCEGTGSESGAAATVEFAEEQRRRIEEWCEKHIGRRLVVTATKDFGMVELWDDRAMRVIANTGQLAQASG